MIRIYKYLIEIWSKSFINIDKKVKKIMLDGIKFSFIICLFSTLILSLYISSNNTYLLFYLGISLFKSSTTFMVIFFVYGILFNKLLQEKK